MLGFDSHLLWPKMLRSVFVSSSKDKRFSKLFTRLCKNWPGLIDFSFAFVFSSIDRNSPVCFASKASLYFSPELSLNECITLIVRFSRCSEESYRTRLKLLRQETQFMESVIHEVTNKFWTLNMVKNKEIYWVYKVYLSWRSDTWTGRRCWQRRKWRRFATLKKKQRNLIIFTDVWLICHAFLTFICSAF